MTMDLKPYFKKKIDIYRDFPGIKENEMVPYIAMRMIMDSQPDDFTYLDVNWLARVLEVKVPFLSKNYQKRFKETIGQAITERKMWWAVRFLVECPDMSIDQIAEKLDYCTGNYFIKVFKQEKEITPLQYRVRYRNSPPEVQEKDRITEDDKRFVNAYFNLFDQYMLVMKFLIRHPYCLGTKARRTLFSDKK